MPGSSATKHETIVDTLEDRVKKSRGDKDVESLDPLPSNPLPTESYRVEQDGLVTIQVHLLGTGAISIEGFATEGENPIGLVNSYGAASAQVEQSTSIHMPL